MVFVLDALACETTTEPDGSPHPVTKAYKREAAWQSSVRKKDKRHGAVEKGKVARRLFHCLMSFASFATSNGGNLSLKTSQKGFDCT